LQERFGHAVHCGEGFTPGVIAAGQGRAPPPRARDGRADGRGGLRQLHQHRLVRGGLPEADQPRNHRPDESRILRRPAQKRGEIDRGRTHTACPRFCERPCRIQSHPAVNRRPGCAAFVFTPIQSTILFPSLTGFPQMPKIPETKPVPAAPGKPALRPQASPLSPLICAEGKFSFTGNGQPLGSETYKITCNPGGGFSVTGHTELSVPGNPLVLSFPDRRHVEFSTPDKSLTLDTRFEADRKGAPVQFSAKGSHGNEPVSVSIAVAGRRAAIEIAGREKQTATADGSPLFVDNVFYLYQF